jgi:hypothetical protein
LAVAAGKALKLVCTGPEGGPFSPANGNARVMTETGQLTPEIAEKKSRGLGSYVVWAFVAVMVYVLSSGPVARLRGVYVGHVIVPATGDRVKVVDGIHGAPPWRQIYWPLEEAYNRTLLHTPLGMYWHLWYPAHYDANGDVRL